MHDRLCTDVRAKGKVCQPRSFDASTSPSRSRTSISSRRSSASPARGKRTLDRRPALTRSLMVQGLTPRYSAAAFVSSSRRVGDDVGITPLDGRADIDGCAGSLAWEAGDL